MDEIFTGFFDRPGWASIEATTFVGVHATTFNSRSAAPLNGLIPRVEPTGAAGLMVLSKATCE